MSVAYNEVRGVDNYARYSKSKAEKRANVTTLRTSVNACEVLRGAHEFGEQAKASNHNATNYQHQPNYVVANKKSSLPNQIELSVS